MQGTFPFLIIYTGTSVRIRFAICPPFPPYDYFSLSETAKTEDESNNKKKYDPLPNQRPVVKEDSILIMGDGGEASFPQKASAFFPRISEFSSSFFCLQDSSLIFTLGVEGGRIRLFKITLYYHLIKGRNSCINHAT